MDANLIEDGIKVCRLVAPLTRLRFLSAFALTGDTYGSVVIDRQSSRNIMRAVAIILQFRALTDLSLRFRAYWDMRNTERFCQDLAAMTQLTRLSIGWLHVGDEVACGIYEQDMPWPEAAAVFGAALASLPRLESLTLEVDPPERDERVQEINLFAHLSNLRGLTQLSVKVNTVFFFRESSAQSFLSPLAKSLAVLKKLQELHIDFGSREVCPPALAEAIANAAQQPAIELISVQVHVSEVAARVLLPVLLPIAAKKLPVLDLQVYMDSWRGRLDVVPFLPLLPHALGLEISTRRFETAGGELWIPGLLSALPMLSKVTCLHIDTDDVSGGAETQHLIEEVAVLTTLRELNVRVEARHCLPETARDGESDRDRESWVIQGPSSEVFMTRVCALTALTCLELEVPARCTPLRMISQACGELTRLRKLSIVGRLADQDDVLTDALSKLHLQTLLVSSNTERRDFVRGVIPKLPHLRALQFHTDRYLIQTEWENEVSGMLRQFLPACRRPVYPWDY